MIHIKSTNGIIVSTFQIPTKIDLYISCLVMKDHHWSNGIDSHLFLWLNMTGIKMKLMITSIIRYCCFIGYTNIDLSFLCRRMIEFYFISLKCFCHTRMSIIKYIKIHWSNNRTLITNIHTELFNHLKIFSFIYH